LNLGPLGVAYLADAYTASDLLLSTSKFESAGMTVVESAACGTASLLLNNGGGEEFARSKSFVVLVNSEAEFTLGLEKFVSGEFDTGQMSTSARQAAKIHESSLVAKSYLDVYNTL
jgi:glycosyltransferase involved in cell wall biosynthesis